MSIAHPIQTRFAPAARLPLAEIQEQAQLLAEYPLLTPLLNALPMAVMVLNTQRQVVHANDQFKRYLAPSKLPNLSGMRTGELLDCIHATDMPAGCGTSEHCRSCGVTNAILTAQQGRAFTGEGRLTVSNNGRPVAVDLNLWAQPFTFSGQRFSLLSAQDVTEDTRRQMLEHTFFHDIVNTATAISGYAELMGRFGTDNVRETKQLAGYISEASLQLMDEITAHRQLVAAESGSLPVEPAPVPTFPLLTSILNLYRQQPMAEDRHVHLDPASKDTLLFSDSALLGRVIGNMVKNALEASQPGDNVTLGCEHLDNHVRFWVHNPQHIPPESQLRVFQRSFSTKGANRGTGTYSMKLLSEGYLNGTVSFSSSAVDGTTFSAVFPVEWTDPS